MHASWSRYESQSAKRRLDPPPFGKDWIFDDESGTLEEHLTDNERASIRAMIEAIEKRKTSDAHYKKWFQKQQVTPSMCDRIDEVYNNLGVAPMQLINEGLEEGEDFLNIIESERATEDVLLAIAGDHALERVPRGDFRDALTSINHHTWEHHRKHFRRAEKGLPNKKLAAAVTVKEIEDADEVAASQLREATKAIKALSMAEFLKEVVVVAVAKARKVLKEKVTVKTDNTPGRKRGAQRARKVKTASLVAAGDVEEIWALYVQLFETEPGQLEPVQDEEDLENSGKAAWLEQSEDLGVDGGKPALFAEFHLKRGLCAWDEASTSKFVEENDDMEPLSLLWHQRVGVAAIVDKIWSATKSDDEVPGILIADEVGVGKTALTMGLIAFVIDAFWVQEVAAGRGRPDGVMSTINMMNVRPAPILAEHPFFAGLDAIPNLPHVIIVPNSLNSQWFSELRTFFAPKALEVYNYPTAENEFGDFFNSAWAKSSTPLIHCIILVNHSVMLTSGKVFDTHKGVAGHNSNKVSDDTRSLKLRKQAAKCLWVGQKFLTVSVDEVHDMRNLTAQFYATLEVTRASIVKLLASGTPLYMGPMDLCNVGCLARIPYFMGKSGDERDKEHVKQLRAARRTMTQEDKNDAAAHTVRLLAGGATTNDDEPEARIRIRDAMTKWINNIKCGYRGRVIRQTVDSQTFDGKKINDTLMPYKMVIVPVQLNEKELEINESVMAQIMGS
ncbi:P-loop containing nucleoside triphosphate hydrolase protein [Suillus spraguei]|nr:P-loop containing nucleoside triphosphate hydrolase protein [Suillus spraguei]